MRKSYAIRISHLMWRESNYPYKSRYYLTKKKQNSFIILFEFLYKNCKFFSQKTVFGCILQKKLS